MSINIFYAFRNFSGTVRKVHGKREWITEGQYVKMGPKKINIVAAPIGVTGIYFY